MSLRIALLAEFTEYGGTRAYFKMLLALYIELGYSVTVVCAAPVDDDMKSFLTNLGVEEIVLIYSSDLSGFAVRNKYLNQLTCESKNSFNFISRLINFINRMRFYHNTQQQQVFKEGQILGNYIDRINPDLIVATVGTPGLYLSIGHFHKPCVYILHSYPTIRGGRVANLLHGLLMAKLIPKTIYFLTVSNYARRQMMSVWGLRFRRDPVQVIYGTTGAELAAQKKVWNNKQFKILMVGHVTQYKNPYMWIEVAQATLKLIPHAEFLWVGDGDLLEDCRSLVVSLGLEGKINFVGFSRAVENFYKDADLYLHLSAMESLGLSVLDAMKFGLPSVVSNVGGLPEVISNENVGFVVPQLDVDRCVECILKVYRSERVYSDMSAAAKERYASFFSISKWRENVRKAHQEALKNYEAR